MVKENSVLARQIIRICLLVIGPVVCILSKSSTPAVISSITLSLLGVVIFGRSRIPAAFARLPFWLTLAFFWGFQFQLTRLSSWAFTSPPVEIVFVSEALRDDFLQPITLSVVLPCANEGEYAVKTVRSIAATTPAYALKEVIVVDDGSKPRLESIFDDDTVKDGKVKFIRHESHTGLINAKRVGGNSATGDIIVFLDCHVKPAEDWYKPLIKHIRQSYRTVVVPSITSLDAKTWEELPRSGGGLAKCYLTWDADFKWFDSDHQYVPIMSGGLLAISRRWWTETGGYDDQMQGWGGENLDQSLRIWLCGGEIIQATDSFVAHMWRTPDKPETRAKYTLPPGSSTLNRYRGTAVWLGPFKEKLDTFKYFSHIRNPDLNSFKQVHDKLQCKPFAWFLKRFEEVYFESGLVADEVFQIKDDMTGLCLTFESQSRVSFAPCAEAFAAQLFHAANRNQNDGGKCCSGFRNWNNDQCLVALGQGAPMTTVTCNTYGKHREQYINLTDDGRLQTFRGHCIGLERAPGPRVGFSECKTASELRVVTKGDVVQFRRGDECATVSVSEGKVVLQLHACVEGDQDQVFMVRRVAGDNVQLVTTYSKQQPQYCLDFAGGAELIAYQCHTVDGVGRTQSFTITDGVVKSSWGTCMSAASMASESLHLEACSKSRRSQSVDLNRQSDGSFMLGMGQGSCITAMDAERVVTSPCDASNEAQRFVVSDGKIKNNKFKTCLDAYDGHVPILYGCYEGENPNQDWFVESGGLKNRHSGKCIDTENIVTSAAKVVSCANAASSHRFVKHSSFQPIETTLFKAEQAKYPELLK